MTGTHSGQEEDGETDRRTLLKGIALGSLGTAGIFGGLGAADGTVGGAVDDVAGGLLGDDSHDGHDSHHVLALVPRDAVTHTASGGQWADATTWGDETPTDGARVHVPAETTLTLTSTTARLQTLRVDGTLRVDPETAARLLVETLVVTGSGRLELGSEETPAQDTVVTFLDSGAIDESDDPERIGRGLLTLPGATVRVRGVEKTSFLELASAPTSGDDELRLAAEPTGWTAGDTVVLPGLSPDRDEDEEREVVAVDGTSVRLDEPLEYDHIPPKSSLPSYVVSLSRTVRLASENDRTKRRGHVMFMSRDVDVVGAEFSDLGRTDKSRPVTDPANGVPPKDAESNPQARYACHFHRTGPTVGDPRVVRDCVVRGSPGWGYVNHDSHVRFEDNVSYQVFGAGFVAEIGTEAGTFKRNFALRSHGSGSVPDGRQFREGDEGAIDDFGHGGYGFWFQGPGVAVEGNVAAGHRHHGFVYWTRAKPDREVPPGELGGVTGELANFPVERIENQPDLVDSDEVDDGMVPSSLVKFRSFRDNTVFASGGGLDISRHRFGAHHDRLDEYSVVDGFLAFNIGRHYSQWDHLRVPNSRGAQGGYNGVSVRYSANVRIRDAHLVAGDGAGRGVGINRNHAPSNVRVEDSTVEGFTVGVRAAPRGESPVTGVLDNEVDVQVIGGTTDRRWTPAQQVDVEAEFGEGGRTNLYLSAEFDDDLYGLFSPEGGVTLNGEGVYFAEQAADYVPFPTRADLDATEKDSLSALTDVAPRKLVGKSNAELYEEYGLAVEGSVLPESAGTDAAVEGGYVAGAADGSRRTEWPGSDTGSALLAQARSTEGSLSEVGRLRQGERLTVYGEDTVQTLPGKYAGLAYVRPEEEDADAERPTALQLSVTAPATVYVAYDAETRPDWLSSWRDTGDTVGTTDGKRRVYAREVDAGTVRLGGCPDTHRMYTPFVEGR
ncbi:G8 domain-containing protein [Halogranum gelatinilyticum]|uniref:G8 domain-containing protein n=1 Tax=Halogranum gelatinilyticum TaxID=660521 RepID=A0A1G9ZDL3_9EURY|nr:G8 domain-containing protein [Halogranum gelatinilyticum]SDN19304.1 G8 domain-containing protein [Halogranum gelatinilyticum]